MLFAGVITSLLPRRRRLSLVSTQYINVKTEQKQTHKDPMMIIKK
mgnify:CR=1 FL=1